MINTKLGEFFCLHRKFLIFNLVNRNLKVRYRKSFFGLLWTVLIPAVQALVYFSVFTLVLKVRTDNYLLLIMCGIVPWTFFATTIMSGLESLVTNQSLLNKVQLPMQSLVYAEALTQFINLLFSLPVVLTILLTSTVPITWATLQYPILLGFLYLFTYSASLILGILYVYFRDLKHLVGLLLQLWFYLTPITYEASMIPDKYRVFLKINPLGVIFDAFHIAIVRQGIVPLETWCIIAAWTLGTGVLSFWIWLRNRSHVIEVL